MVRTRVAVVSIVLVSVVFTGLAPVDQGSVAAADRPAAGQPGPEQSLAGPEQSLAGPTAATSTPTGTPSQPSTDDTVTRVQVYENGSARWTIEIRTRLRTDGDVERFRTYQERFRENTSAVLDPFADRMRGVVASAANATGREMAATGFAAETRIQEVPRRWGVVSLSFRWTSFAATDGDALVVGDVFQGGFFLAENDSLVVTGPEGYEVSETAPQPDESETRTVTWEGRTDFEDRRPRVLFEPADDDPTGAATEGSTMLVGLAVVGLLIIVAGAWLHRRRAAGTASAGRTVERKPGPGDGSDRIMTDPELVADLLGDRGGRMKQAEVADALDWSDSKTSRVIADMVEDGRVEKLRVGRENVVELREE